MSAGKRFSGDEYGEGYWERAEGSNYRDYGDDPGWGIIADIFQRLRSNARVIEAACAKGYFVAALRDKLMDAEGFDLSEYAIEHAPVWVKGHVRVHDAIDPWPYEDAAAEIVCSWEFLEHIHDENIPAVLDEMVRVLKPGGELWLKIGIVIPDDHPFAGQEDHDHTHVAMHERAWWEDQFRTAGLEQLPDMERVLDTAFDGRDWVGRFFVWRKPS